MSGHSIVERPGALSFDSTQTIRAVTVRELRDPNQQKWFAVQLAVSDRPVNLEALPRFEVFAAYSLYAIQGRLGANACYALRLGFFTDQPSAQAICTDLKAFYRSASVVRVSEAEQARFKPEVPVQKPSPSGADVVAISSARPPTITPPKSVASVNTTAPKPVAQPKKAAGVAPGRKQGKSLSQELLEEARQIERAKSGKSGGKKRSASWLSRLLGRSSD
jgi:hypothetical protein